MSLTEDVLAAIKAALREESNSPVATKRPAGVEAICGTLTDAIRLLAGEAAAEAAGKAKGSMVERISALAQAVHDHAAQKHGARPAPAKVASVSSAPSAAPAISVSTAPAKPAEETPLDRYAALVAAGDSAGAAHCYEAHADDIIFERARRARVAKAQREEQEKRRR